ncbi:hypothetical protein GBF38_013756 [Nibea albiflora]|uniref:Uncharacterized protein n=1 Tax=Nibea albiflora TaxID=240163 RepID=A0ACB7FA72_NIBAL|nr:hypothetical protein GBF38_013756 [Nibea albiflora]
MKLGVLLEILEDLTDSEFQKFKWYLGFPVLEEYQAIRRSRLERANRLDIVDLMVQTYNIHGALKVTRKVLMKLSRSDLVHQLDISFGAECQ